MISEKKVWHAFQGSFWPKNFGGKKMCPFEIVYGFLPCAPIDLLPLPSSEKVNFDAKQRAELILKNA